MNDLTPYYHGSGMTLTYEREWLPKDRAAWLLARLFSHVSWRQDSITVRGRTHLLPRLQQWYGDEGSVYSYAGIKMEPLPWLPYLQEIREDLERVVGKPFNSVLLNLYRNGSDTVGWHADDEPELGVDPVIASISLGAERDLLFKHNDPNVRADRVRIALAHGSLLVMSGQTQRCWKHSLPRRARVTLPRINLTFRNIT